MPMKNFGNLLLACMAALLGACAGESAGKCDAVVRIDADSVVNRGYIGNGVQWDPYALDYGQGRVEISDADWAKLYARLDFMRPAFIRVMTNTTSVVRNGRLDRMRGFEHRRTGRNRSRDRPPASSARAERSRRRFRER